MLLSAVFRLPVIFAFGTSLLVMFGADAYSICTNPAAYEGRVVDDPWRNAGYRGECVSYVKVGPIHYIIAISIMCLEYLKLILYQCRLALAITVQPDSGEEAFK